jgi:hypothetical protein
MNSISNLPTGTIQEEEVPSTIGFHKMWYHMFCKQFICMVKLPIRSKIFLHSTFFGSVKQFGLTLFFKKHPSNLVLHIYCSAK